MSETLLKLSGLLPRLRTRTQLTGLVLVVAGFIASTQVARQFLPGTIAVGIVGVFFLIFGQLFSSLEHFPQKDRKQVVLIVIGLFVFLVSGVSVAGAVLTLKGH